jgi:hypothetical protein
MNGDFRYTNANMNLPNYYENFQGLVGESATAAGVTPAYPAQAIRSATFTGSASGKAGGRSCRLRRRLAGDKDGQSLRSG